MIREILAQIEPRALRGGSAVLAVFMFVVVFTPTPASAGFFDFLFDPKAPIWNPFAPEPQQAQPTQRAAPVRKKKPHRPVARAPRIEKTQPSGAPLASRDFMDDGSLRGGDAVMTPNGIRIFTGPPGDRHRPEQFSTLDEIKGLGKRERSALSALDGHTASTTRAETKGILATGRSAAENIAAGALITDPKGRSIRYVGP
jgi:hypothetical protein